MRLWALDVSFLTPDAYERFCVKPFDFSLIVPHPLATPLILFSFLGNA
jgi:hypothetical protein